MLVHTLEALDLNQDVPAKSKPFEPGESTLERRRALLGCFLLSSMYACPNWRDSFSFTVQTNMHTSGFGLIVANSVSSYCGDLDPMRWTPYMDECLQSLREARESPFDEGFIIQVRAQRLFQAVKDDGLRRGLAGLACK